MPLITYEQWCRAGRIFRNFAMQLPHDQRPLFDVYVGATFPHGWHPSRYTHSMKADEARRIEHMLGPNAHTMFKLYLAQHGPHWP